jgi:YggT family protein
MAGGNGVQVPRRDFGHGSQEKGPVSKRGVTMFIVGNFLIAVAKILNIGLSIYMWIIIARAVISWVSPDPYNPIVRFLNNVTEPVLYRVRRLIPVYFGGFDFSPILVILAIIFIQSFLIQSLYQIAVRLG